MALSIRTLTKCLKHKCQLREKTPQNSVNRNSFEHGRVHIILTLGHTRSTIVHQWKGDCSTCVKTSNQSAKSPSFPCLFCLFRCCFVTHLLIYHAASLQWMSVWSMQDLFFPLSHFRPFFCLFFFKTGIK